MMNRDEVRARSALTERRLCLENGYVRLEAELASAPIEAKLTNLASGHSYTLRILDPMFVVEDKQVCGVSGSLFPKLGQASVCTNNRPHFLRR